MKTKTAMYIYYPTMLVSFAGLGVLGEISARHYLSTAASWRIAEIIFVLCLLPWLVMLWIRSKHKENPEIARARSKPVERILAGFALCVIYANLFCFLWPKHQSLASVESRWQFVFLVGVLLLAGLLMVPPSVFLAGKTALDARPRTLKMLLPRLIGFCAIVVMLQVVFNFWHIQN